MTSAGLRQLSEERRQWLVDRARSDGRLDVAAVSEELSVAVETIRRDLNQLEGHGLLRRVHGGAIPVERSQLDGAVGPRLDLDVRAQADRGVQGHRAVMEQVQRPDVDRAAGQVDAGGGRADDVLH